MTMTKTRAPRTSPRGLWKAATLFTVLALAAMFAACGYFIAPRGQALSGEAAAPDFALKDATGADVRLADLVERGPAVVLFYRGFW